jgi:hypothetical protein
LVNQNNAARKVVQHETVRPKHIATFPDLAAAHTLSDRNCEPVTGQGFRWVKRFCLAHGVKVHAVGHKRFVVASEFFAALLAAKDEEEPATQEQGTAYVLRQLGLEVRK